MEVFVQFLHDNLALVIITVIALVGIIGISATLITFKIMGKVNKNKARIKDDIAEPEEKLIQ